MNVNMCRAILYEGISSRWKRVSVATHTEDDCSKEVEIERTGVNDGRGEDYAEVFIDA